MNFETPQLDNEKKEELVKFENRIQEIKDALANQGYNKELDLEFVELWKNTPNGIGDETNKNIDEIRSLLMDGALEKD